MDWLKDIHIAWYILLTLSVLTLQVATTMHALLNKRDSRAAMGWAGFIWFSPVIGAFAYWILGVNRIQRSAAQLKEGHQELVEMRADHPERVQGLDDHHFPDLARLVERVVRRPLLQGNRIEPLINGDEAFPAMLEAMANARNSITLSTYIFDLDPAGKRFIDALKKAHERGVSLRVLIDDVGSRYSPRPVARVLSRLGIRAARFIPRTYLRRLVAMNLRSHRKVLVMDGAVGFTGGMNIRHGNCLRENPPHAIQDVHFRIEGPVVTQLQEVFADDWLFCTGERLRGDIWFPNLKPVGDLEARAIPDGPDEDFEKITWTLYGAIGCAEKSVLLVTPYFLPEREMITVLNVAALRGVTVDLVLPEKNNLVFMHWASRASWSLLLERGCRVWLSKPPFDHSKIMVVDGKWSMVGSANLDPRSLRLNFELNVEVYGEALAESLTELARAKMKAGREVTLKELEERSFGAKLGDGVARIFTPYM